MPTATKVRLTKNSNKDKCIDDSNVFDFDDADLDQDHEEAHVAKS